MGSIKEILTGNITPKQPRSLAEQSADKLRELILLEKLPPSLPVNERDLSDMLSVSRTPVRDAIKMLEVEGLIDYSETRRPRVADPEMDTLSQWLLVQGALEGLAGEQACIHATHKELDNIIAIHGQMVELAESDDRMRLFKLDMEFHSAIVMAAHLPPLVETHKLYNSRLWSARFISSQRRANRQQQQMKHQGIVDALMARNETAASKALTAHLRNAISNIKAARAERDALKTE
ncbi:MAG: GntR family transcriptional regulator [Pseudomonadota bacterium]|nr:GntR family transcriptional regulator [Pseudomonadota bacterium]